MAQTDSLWSSEIDFNFVLWLHKLPKLLKTLSSPAAVWSCWKKFILRTLFFSVKVRQCSPSSVSSECVGSHPHHAFHRLSSPLMMQPVASLSSASPPPTTTINSVLCSSSSSAGGAANTTSSSSVASSSNSPVSASSDHKWSHPLFPCPSIQSSKSGITSHLGSDHSFLNSANLGLQPHLGNVSAGGCSDYSQYHHHQMQHHRDQSLHHNHHHHPGHTSSLHAFLGSAAAAAAAVASPMSHFVTDAAAIVADTVAGEGGNGGGGGKSPMTIS